MTLEDANARMSQANAGEAVRFLFVAVPSGTCMQCLAALFSLQQPASEPWFLHAGLDAKFLPDQDTLT
jgi:hypothetical protein